MCVSWIYINTGKTTVMSIPLGILEIHMSKYMSKYRESYMRGHFINRKEGNDRNDKVLFHEYFYEMTRYVRFCLSYDF